MEFSLNFSDEHFEDILYLYDDESIISNNMGDFVLYFNSYNFGLSIDKKTKRIKNFVGYSSGFDLINVLEVPKARKGGVYIEAQIDGDGTYYPEVYGFIAKGFYEKKTGWYSLGEYSLGDVVEIATNTLINICDGKIKSIFFKPVAKR